MKHIVRVLVEGEYEVFGFETKKQALEFQSDLKNNHDIDSDYAYVVGGIDN